MAQTLTFNDADVEVQIDTSAAGTDLRITGEEGHRVVNAIRNLKAQIPTLRRVEWDIPGGGIVGRLGVWADGTPRIIYLNFEDLALPSPDFYYTFVNGPWTDAELGYIDKLKDAFLDFNSGHTLTSSVAGIVSIEPAYDGITSYYGLNETSGTRYDSVSAVHLSPVGPPLFDSSIFRRGAGGLRSDNLGEYVQSTTASYNFAGQPFTFCAWIMVGAFQAVRVDILGKYNGTNPASICIDSDKFGIFKEGVQSMQGGTISFGTWYHVAYAKDSGDAHRLFVNGSQVITSGAVPIIDGSEYAIGPFNGAGALSATLRIDEVAFFDSYIGESRITSLYNNGLGIYY